MKTREGVKSFHIKKGKNLSLAGEASADIVDMPLPEMAAVQPVDFRGINARVQVKVGDSVGVGSVLVSDKVNPAITVVSPASGKVIDIKRGHRRCLDGIIIKVDGLEPARRFAPLPREEIRVMPREKIVERLLDGGLWPFIRQRPFSRVARPAEKPKSIFIQAMNTEPLAPRADVILRGKKELFFAGLEIMAKLTDGPVNLCYSRKEAEGFFSEAPSVHHYVFNGPHPAGNVSTHIHYVDPIRKGEAVWYLNVQDLLSIAASFASGYFIPERIAALTGEGVSEADRKYYRTIIGAPLKSFTGFARERGKKLRYISGSVLAGRDVGKEGFLTFYASQIYVLPEAGPRQFLGWLTPGLNKVSFTRTFVSALFPGRKNPVSTDVNGSLRAIVLSDIYDDLVPLDILVFFLARAILSGDIDEAEALGILECDEEDFALCTFACPSKVDISGIIRRGLDMVEKEG